MSAPGLDGDDALARAALEALESSDAAALARALDAGWSPGAELAPQEPALGLASGKPECVELLLGAGADPDARCGRLRQTPLMRAAAAGCSRSVNLLLAAGARPELDDLFGRDAAWSARKANRHQLARALDEIAEAAREARSAVSLGEP